MHAGALECGRFGKQVCFAGIGPGEVTVDGVKVVGLSQRRRPAPARGSSASSTGRGHPEPLTPPSPASSPTSSLRSPSSTRRPRAVEAALLTHLPDPLNLSRAVARLRPGAGVGNALSGEERVSGRAAPGAWWGKG